jgi:hypothetical protein
LRLRDILREELGQTYHVSVNVAQRLPLRGSAYIAVGFGADPANLDAMISRVLQEVGQFQKGRAVARFHQIGRRREHAAVTSRPSAERLLDSEHAECICSD